jgi:hypothetical protein
MNCSSIFQNRQKCNDIYLINPLFGFGMLMSARVDIHIKGLSFSQKKLREASVSDERRADHPLHPSHVLRPLPKHEDLAMLR